MPTTQIKKPPTFKSERIKVHCPECAVRLCDRKLMAEGWHLHFRHSFFEGKRYKRAELYTKEAFVRCRDCKVWHKITADEGIVESSKNGTGI